MAKTELTKQIEERLKSYKPKELDGYKLNYMRDQYCMHEVPVTHGSISDGLVDFVWLAEGFTNIHKRYICRAPYYAKRNLPIGLCNCTLDNSVFLSWPDNYECTTDVCDTCPYKSYTIMQSDTRAVICFEIKISKADFNSGHGRNFVGNLNYYVMPVSLYKEVKDDIPQDIGCIVYSVSDKQETLRKRKAAVWRDIDSQLYTSMLLTCLNKYRKSWSKERYELNRKLDRYYDIVGNLITQKMQVLRTIELKPECFMAVEPTEIQLKLKEYFADTLSACANTCSNNSKCIDCVFNQKYAINTMEKISKSLF